MVCCSKGRITIPAGSPLRVARIGAKIHCRKPPTPAAASGHHRPYRIIREKTKEAQLRLSRQKLGYRIAVQRFAPRGGAPRGVRESGGPAPPRHSHQGKAMYSSILSLVRCSDPGFLERMTGNRGTPLACHRRLPRRTSSTPSNTNFPDRRATLAPQGSSYSR